MWPLKVVDEAKDAHNYREGSDIGSDPRHGLISIPTDEIGRCRNNESPCAQSRSEEVDGHNPIPDHMYLPFHKKLLLRKTHYAKRLPAVGRHRA